MCCAQNQFDAERIEDGLDGQHHAMSCSSWSFEATHDDSDGVPFTCSIERVSVFH